MKITDEEKEAAYELQWMVQQILFERERAQLYREVYAHCRQAGMDRVVAGRAAKAAIDDMEHAFEPVCPTCAEESERAAQQKAN